MTNNKTPDKGLKDIELCYTAMGLSIGDSPAKIEMMYNRLCEMYKAKLIASDPRAHMEAKENLDLIEEMYNKIKNSVTYQSMAKDYEKRGKLQGEERSRPSDIDATLLKSSMMNCPKCHTVISKDSKVCPRCKTPILTQYEMIMKTVFTKTNIIVFFCIVVIGIMVIIGLLFSDQINDMVNSFTS